MYLVTTVTLRHATHFQKLLSKSEEQFYSPWFSSDTDLSL